MGLAESPPAAVAAMRRLPMNTNRHSRLDRPLALALTLGALSVGVGCGGDDELGTPTPEPVAQELVTKLPGQKWGSQQSGITAAASSKVTYGGGAVLSHVRTVALFWGPNVNSTVVSGGPAFLSAVTDSNYLDWMDEYFSASPTSQPIGRGSYWGSYVVPTLLTSGTVRETD